VKARADDVKRPHEFFVCRKAFDRGRRVVSPEYNAFRAEDNDVDHGRRGSQGLLAESAAWHSQSPRLVDGLILHSPDFQNSFYERVGASASCRDHDEIGRAFLLQNRIDGKAGQSRISFLDHHVTEPS
jgi:hypothetical protein